MSFRKGIIPPIVTLGILMFLGIFSFSSATLLSQRTSTSTKAQDNCTEIVAVKDPGELSPEQSFRCEVTIASGFAGSPNVSCGWSKNGAWPSNGGKWENATCAGGTNCTFDIRMDRDLDIFSTYELVGFDFRPECGSSTGKRIPLKVRINGVPSPSPTLVSSPTTTFTPVPTIVFNPTAIPSATLRTSPSPQANPTPDLSWLKKGTLYIENISQKNLVRIVLVSFGGKIDVASQAIGPGQQAMYSFKDACSLFSAKIKGWIAYYSSVDRFEFIKLKEVDLSCDKTEVIGLE